MARKLEAAGTNKLTPGVLADMPTDRYPQEFDDLLALSQKN